MEKAKKPPFDESNDVTPKTNVCNVERMVNPSTTSRKLSEQEGSTISA
jgi:hypothetical protein